MGGINNFSNFFLTSRLNPKAFKQSNKATGQIMSSNYSVDVGTPPAGDQKTWQSRAVHFHGFRDLPSERNESVSSPDFKCLGHNWCLDLYPGGDTADPSPSEGMVAIYLCCILPSEDICIEFYFAVRNSAGKEVAHTRSHSSNIFDKHDKISWGKFLKRSTMIDALVEGTLTIELGMRKSAKSLTLHQNPFIPENPIHKNIVAMFMEEESADVIFEVGGVGRGGRSCKRAKTAATTFHAHRFIVQKIASTFSDMCQANEGGEVITIPITDVQAGVFRLMLYYGYGGEISDEELKENAKELIDAADKYGMTSLKLTAEACYVKSTTLGVDNILENLLYVHAKNCALLKEAAMDFVVQNRGSIMDKVSLEEVPGSMIKDVLAAMARWEKDDGFDCHSMRVCTLRSKLKNKGLDVDGSREAMIALLKEHS